MFDFHIHTDISFDGRMTPEAALRYAEKNGLSEICFTDHYDHNSKKELEHFLFDIEDYKRAYEHLSSPTAKIRKGVEFGLTDWNVHELRALAESYPFDFVIGSVHYVREGVDVYFKEYWEGKTPEKAARTYLLQTLDCVRLHDGFDVLGHINYLSKSPANPTHKPIAYKDHADIVDEIFKTLIQKGIGIEVNTSGFDRVGYFLPDRAYLVRFRELGGEIVTVGSDAHDDFRVGKYTHAAVELVASVFGHVCTFEDRKPIFHKL